VAIKFHNTLTGKTEEFHPIDEIKVRMYHCGPTVYGIQHIGNLSMFVFTDILRRTLELGGWTAKQVINITDFGHLTSDADEGEDKMAKGLKKEGLEFTLENMLALGKKYGGIFLNDLSKLNIKTEGTFFPYASDYVVDQIDLVRKLEEKGFVYVASDGVYFDTGKFSGYGKLGGLSDSETQARVISNPEKKSPRDFVVWKLNSELGWQSPWGQGFPGWHIECSAMILKLLGEQIDIHTGGIEHIPVHHNNEIAQSEAATGKTPFSRFWLHRAHLQIGGQKIAKSEGNVVYLSEIIEKGFSPLAFRYMLLQSHYRTPASFTWEALEAAQNAYRKLKELVSTPSASGTSPFAEGGKIKLNSPPAKGELEGVYIQEFKSVLENDLNTPAALAVVWNLIKDEAISPADKYATLLEFDKVLGLDLAHNEFLDVSREIVELGEKRQKAKEDKNFEEADKIRQEIEDKGFEIRDIDNTFLILKK